MHVRKINNIQKEDTMGLNFGRKVEAMKAAVATCSDASIMESVEGLAEASASLYECQADGSEICQVLDNLTLVAQAVSNGGVTKQVLGAFNSEGEMCGAAGVENLTVEGLEAMATADVEKFSKKVTAGLEGQMAEYWAKFVEWLKNLWTKLVNWLKSQFTNQARYVKYLEAAKASLKEVNGDAQAAVHAKADMVKVLKSCQTMIGQLKAAGDAFKNSGALVKGGADSVGARGIFSKLNNFMASDEKTKVENFNNGEAPAAAAIKSFGYGSAGDISGAIDVYLSVAKSTDFAAASKAFTDGLANFQKEAQNAAKLEGEAQSAAKAAVAERRQVVNDLLACVRMVAKTVQKCGGELQKVVKAAGVKAAAPEAK